MKASYGMILVLACATAMYGAKQRWSYDDADTIRMIVADGSGGCAYTREETNDTVGIVWLNKSGNPVYQLQVNTNEPIVIVRCTKKELLYVVSRNGLWQYERVTPGGTPQVISAPGQDLRGAVLAHLLAPSRTTDAKGFFGILVKMPGTRMSIVRFDNK